MALRSLAQLIGATCYNEFRIELLAFAFAVVALTASHSLSLPVRPSPNPNPSQVHLTHPLTQNASSGEVSGRGRDTAFSSECVGQRKEERRDMPRSHLAGWTLAVPYIKSPQYLDCSRRLRLLLLYVAFTGGPRNAAP